MKLWIRLGDSGDYECCNEDIGMIAGVLVSARIVPDSVQGRQGGLTAPGYEGKNYISAYWGDDKDGTEKVRDLTTDEVVLIKEYMQMELSWGDES